ncbi:MAG: Flp pilus assembly complex ATPase component TadA [Solobacterium sp.]|nr:Flp pilus assembly complex ATPase component TadA [Solobacterium sp.]
MEELLRDCLRTALKHHVTDIHFSLRDAEVRTEMRVRGEMRQLRKQYDPAFFRYLMYRADLDVTNVLEPQTGRFETEVDGRVLALRFAVVSSFHITSGVLRILNNHGVISLSALSAEPSQEAWFSDITRHRSGLYVFSGPTGSGKTTTLYAILDHAAHKKIYTLEDPVEVYSEKYVQLQINEKQNLGYADGIKQLMRHDPDIIMIGEIRDGTAARMAVRSALTGHLVVTSLHSFSCLGAIRRLVELGVPAYQLQDVLEGVSCQRLYDTADGGRIGVYEIMDRAEVRHYFEHGTTTAAFVPLAARLEEAVAAGLVSADQAAADLD